MSTRREHIIQMVQKDTQNTQIWSNISTSLLPCRTPPQQNSTEADLPQDNVSAADPFTVPTLF